jgi:hypothetical protein
MKENKKIYSCICDNENIPIFSQLWWLDVTAGKNGWDVLILEKSGNLLAAMPYVYKKIGPVLIMKMPKLTPWLHIWFNYPPGSKYSTRLAFEKEALSKLIPQLPNAVRFHQKYSCTFQNWLPFYWQDYRQTTRYTYRFDELSDLDTVQKGFEQNTRYDIRKASRLVRIDDCTDIERFQKIKSESMDAQGRKISYSESFMSKLDNVCSKKNCRKIYIALDEQGRDHATIYLVYDKSMVYYLLGARHPKFQNSAANTLLIWKAIQFASSQNKGFDFEGSMIEPIERFFRSFGARQQPYFAISKNNGLLKVISLLQ